MSSAPSHDTKESTRFRGASRNDIAVEEIRRWRKKCETTHGDGCTNDHRGDLQEHLSRLLLLDTLLHCIVESASSTKYIALSYVWGGVPTVKLTTTNMADFMQSGSLRNVTLPHTIRDAVSWTAALGERYLWVDCLCVLQDAATEQMNHVLKAMGHIYASAELTIVAANGSHANFGLPGFGQLSDEDLRNVGPIEMPIVSPFWPDFSVWAHRGWTYQESLFSRRLLIFGPDDKIYWLCGESHWSKLSLQKDFDSEEQNRVGWHRIRGYDISIKSWQSAVPWLKDWAGAVDTFTHRTLTFESDSERAFAGARHALARNFRVA